MFVIKVHGLDKRLGHLLHGGVRTEKAAELVYRHLHIFHLIALIDVLGDYDVIGLNTTQKRIFIIECKVLQPIGSVFEHSNQQKRFFTKEKFDEKFQKRIDYFSKVAMSFFANHGYDTEGFTINPYMVVNKVFSSYYKHVQFPIVTFDELKREIQL